MLRFLNFFKKPPAYGSLTGRYFGQEGLYLHGAAFDTKADHPPLTVALLDGAGEILAVTKANRPCDRDQLPPDSGFVFPVPMAWLHHPTEEIAFSFRILGPEIEFPKEKRTLSRLKLTELALSPPPPTTDEAPGARAVPSPAWGSPEWKSQVGQNLKSLRQKLRKAPETADWNFPWGPVIAPRLETVPPQIDDIYLKDGYRFEPTGPAPIILDGGGNIGLSALWFRKSYPNAEITVYEADPQLAKVIRSNLAQAGITDVRIEPCALWIANGPLAFAGEGDDSGHLVSDGGRTVEARDIAEAVGQGVDLLKLDIEGAEFACLNHLMQTGAIDRVQRLVAELHINQANFDQALEVLAGLRSHGFRLAFEALMAESLGPEASVSPFTRVGEGKTFVQLFAWKP